MLAERAATLERELTTRPERPSAEVIERVLDAMPAAVSVVDAQGRLILIDRAYERLLGMARDQALGQLLAESHDEEFVLQSGVLDDKVLETGEALASPTHETLSTSGGTRWVVMSKAPLDAAPAGRARC